MTMEVDDIAIDNAISNQPWPWDYYIDHSKIQRVILFILSKRSINDPDVWNGALGLEAVKHLLFKNKPVTASQRASLSRSIRRLEEEGLINRERGISEDGYTTHIGLTQRGWYQVQFERSWYPEQQLVKLLTFYSLKTKYGL